MFDTARQAYLAAQDDPWAVACGFVIAVKEGKFDYGVIGRCQLGEGWVALETHPHL